jgi:hypothetical protein
MPLSAAKGVRLIKREHLSRFNVHHKLLRIAKNSKGLRYGDRSEPSLLPILL